MFQLLIGIPIRKSGQSGLVGWGIAIRIGKFLVQTTLGARLGLGTKPHYEFLGDL